LKLSFAEEEEGDEEVKENGQDSPEEKEPKKRKMLKDPSIDTSFLPDREREEKERIEREELRKEWLIKQEQMKSK
jgi:protein FAM50